MQVNGLVSEVRMSAKWKYLKGAVFAILIHPLEACTDIQGNIYAMGNQTSLKLWALVKSASSTDIPVHVYNQLLFKMTRGDQDDMGSC